MQLSFFPYQRPQASPSCIEHSLFITLSALVISPCLKEEPCVLVSFAFLLVGCYVMLSPRWSTSRKRYTASCMKPSLGQYSKYSIYQPQFLMPQKHNWDSGRFWKKVVASLYVFGRSVHFLLASLVISHLSLKHVSQTCQALFHSRVFALVIPSAWRIIPHLPHGWLPQPSGYSILKEALSDYSVRLFFTTLPCSFHSQGLSYHVTILLFLCCLLSVSSYPTQMTLSKGWDLACFVHHYTLCGFTLSIFNLNILMSFMYSAISLCFFYMTFPMPELLLNTLLGIPYSTFNFQPTGQFLIYGALQFLLGKINSPSFVFLYSFVHTSILTLLPPLGNY